MGTRPLPSATGAAADSRTIAEAAPEPPSDRKCGRCQQPFPGDPSLFFQSDWGLCSACTAILMPGRRDHRAARPASAELNEPLPS